MTIQCSSVIRVWLVLVLAFVLGWSNSFAKDADPRHENKVPHEVESKARRLTHDLRQQGFEVRRGYFKLWTIDDCAYSVLRMGLCFGNNPAAPYVITTVPPWPEEFVDPWLSSIWGPSRKGYNDIYRFDPREAIVILAQLPPPGAYFSEQTWLFTRRGSFRTDSARYLAINAEFPAFISIFFATVPDHPERIQAFSSLSNIVNNVVIERSAGSAFDQIRYFIVTPDHFMDRAVRKALTRVAVRDEDVFTEPIPSDMITGLNEASDDFTTWFRYTHPYDGGGRGTASNAWRSELPMVVMRVRDRDSQRAPQRYPPVVLEARTAVNEWTLEDDLGRLMAAVGQRWGQPCAEPLCSDRATIFQDLQTEPAYLVGPLCNAVPGENCLGDTQDTTYQLYGPLSLDNGEIYAVAGPLGTETGNATYVGLGINQSSILKGVADLPNDKLKGTANAYGGSVPNADKFFLYYFTRDCSGLEYLTDDHCLSLRTMIPPRDTFTLTIRDYIKRDTQRGPDSSLLLPPEALLLRRK